MNPEEWKKVWLNSFCVVCNPHPDGNTTSAHPLCLTTKFNWRIDPAILKRVGLGHCVPGANAQSGGQIAEDQSPARDGDVASQPRQNEAGANTLGESCGSDESCAGEQGQSHDEIADQDEQAEPEEDKGLDSGKENEPQEQLKRCSRCNQHFPMSFFKAGINSCKNCRQKEKDARQSLKNQRRCTRCREPLDLGFIGVRCQSCRTRHNNWAKSHPKNMNGKGGGASAGRA
ncbi:hypothetical protein B0T21DRAFT_347605 [Apiosordaria backusii]|uniref:Uncharacterized protein n=1 Tax=Apiosordaria backusii TaxID=314023 RepID=A0AA40BN73_9PEZI|nr:hypothetical protein B0T21DRAFT_347605 [Apiosordaria backusii]